VANGGWRLLMMSGAVPALLTFFIRLFVPESERWEEEKSRGTTSNWAAQDLVGVLAGAGGGVAVIGLWAAPDLALAVRIAGSVPAIIIATLGYLYPVVRYLRRSAGQGGATTLDVGQTLRRLLLGAALGGIALLGTWASIQQVPTWAYEMTRNLEPAVPHAKSYTQICTALGAIGGTLLAALLGDWLGRRITYCLLCITSLASALLLFQFSGGYGDRFLFFSFLAGGLTASFYGWLPLYLPELFPTRVRATGQGFSFNFGRIIAAIGTLQGGYLIRVVFQNDFATVCSIMSLIYLVGVGIIWLAPETRGKPLPE
jgi:MFS transporter, SHS family, sialic acid transporter